MNPVRKVILQVAVTLDGFIEGPNGEYDWCFTDQDYGMKDFLARTDTVFVGRKSFELIDQTIFGDRKYYVFSNTLRRAPGNTEIIGGDIAAKVRSIKAGKGKDIWLFGGAALTSSLMSVGLVDELSLAVHPILLGNGKRLFGSESGFDSRNKAAIELIDTQSYSTGLVMMNYRMIEKKMNAAL